PESLADRLVATPGAASGERKRVTVLFCDIAGSVKIADRLDPEEYRDLLDRYVELCIREIYRFEGIVNQLAGDGVMALFGAPIAHEDAPERAVRAALAIRAALVRLNDTVLAERDFELKARFGINTGPVIVGTVGNDLKMDYTATGDTTNLASRLESLAQPNAILISAATERLVRGRFEMREVGPLEVKGKRDAIVAYEVLGTVDEASAMSLVASRDLTRLVGRDEELAQLEACYRRLHGRLPQVVSLVGEAGSGRSRLIYELKQRLARELPIILEARCSSLSHMLPYAPWTAMLRHYFEIPAGERGEDASQHVRRRLVEIDPRLAQLEPKLSRMLSLPTEPSAESPEDVKRDIFEAVAHLVMAMSAKAPVVMIFEDLHWMDEPSREMLELAVAKLRGVRVMIVVSHRPDFEPHWRPGAAFTQLHLRPLSGEQATAMVRAIAGGELPPELEERVCEKAEGNPFFLEEITRAILEDGSLVKSGGRLRLTRPIQDILIPETVQEVIGARIDRLGPAAKRTAQVAAVLGRQFRRDQLTRLLESEGIDVAAELEELEHRGIVHRKTVLSEDEFRFGESVTQEIAYESLLVRERRALHGRIARLLEELPGEPSAERSALLAHHFARSEDRDKAIEALLRAAADAERVPSYQAAREFYGAAWTAASTALEHGADDALARQALAAALGLCHMSIIYTSVGDMEEIERVARRGRELARALGVKSAYAAFPSYEGLAAIAGGGERFAHGLALIEEALGIARRENLSVNAVNISRGLAFAYLFDGRFVESQDLLNRALAELESFDAPGKPSDLWFGVRFMRESVLFHSDQVDAAMESARETHEHATRHNNRTVRTGTASLLAQAHFLRGQYAEAMRWADQSLDVAREIGNIGACRPSAAVALAARVELGMPPSAPRFLRHIEARLAGATNLPLYVRNVIEALVSIGELKRGETVLEHVDRQSGGRLREALCAGARAELLRHDPRRLADAERHAARAVALAEETGARSTLATSLVTSGQIALARG
ncbi:MAG: adenylate/guanylate cyclase domain-containing protein, partial [Thermodesulfobacteriota bacterium]